MTDQSPEKDTLDELIYPKITGYGLKHLEKLKIIQELTPDIAQALRACVPEKKRRSKDLEYIKDHSVNDDESWAIGHINGYNTAIDEIDANITAFIGGDSDE